MSRRDWIVFVGVASDIRTLIIDDARWFVVELRQKDTQANRWDRTRRLGRSVRLQAGASLVLWSYWPGRCFYINL